MTDMAQDMFDDISFYIGDDADGFNTSMSVCDSDISETDSESDDFDDFDHGDWLEDKPTISHRDGLSPRAGLTLTKSEHKVIKEISCLTFKNGNVRTRNDVRENNRNAEWGVITNGKASNTPLSAISKRHLLNKTFNSPLNAKSKCHLLDRNRNTRLNASSQFYLFNKNSDLLNKKCDTSVKTVSTTASEVDQEDDNYKNFLLYLKDRGQTEDMCSLSSGLTKREPSRITRCISNPVVSTLPSRSPIETILENPLYCSAILLVVAHDPKKRNSRLCGTHQASEEAMPVM